MYLHSQTCLGGSESYLYNLFIQNLTIYQRYCYPNKIYHAKVSMALFDTAMNIFRIFAQKWSSMSARTAIPDPNKKHQFFHLKAEVLSQWIFGKDFYCLPL